jgi:hypothetical protein
MRKLPTSVENIILDIAFDLMGQSRINRTLDEYMQIAARLPPLKVLHGMINERLSQMAAAGDALYEICRFKAGDKYYRYEPPPTSVSLETVRNALTVARLREKRRRRSRI